MCFECLERIESRIESHVRRDSRQGLPFDDRTDIVDDQLRHGRFRLRRHHHPEQPAHRRPHPCHAIGAGVREHCSQRCQISRKAIIAGIAQPFAVAAAGHVGTKHAEAPGKALREKVKIAAVAGESVHADDHARIIRSAPLAIDDAMESVSAEAPEAIFTGKAHARARDRSARSTGAKSSGKSARPSIVANDQRSNTEGKSGR